MTVDAPWALPELAEPRVTTERRASDGALIVRSAQPLGAYPRCLGDLLVANAERIGERVFLGERRPVGDPRGQGDPWRTVTWSQAHCAARSLGQALLDRGAGPERPLLLLSGNSIAHALLTLAAMHVGVPAVPVSVAYSLASSDYAKLRRIAESVTPAVVFAEQPAPFRQAIAAAGLDRTATLSTGAELEAWLDTPVSGAVDRAFEAIGPDTIAKILFTSGSTGSPKGVINTHRMLASNQAALAQLWPFLSTEPPEICDWLPWNHTFGANFNFNMVLMHGGTLWIDHGKPAPGLFAATVANLRERAPSLYFNVPRGFELLIAELEGDAQFRDHFFSRLKLIFYAGAALPQNLWRRLEALAIAARGQRVLMVSAWGSTETAPCSTAVHWPIQRAGVIGNPMPGTEIAMVPNGDKLELRVRGPNVTPGYWRDPRRTAEAFDEHGFYRIGDAGKLADRERPERGMVFDGRVAEDFKLNSGTWVHVGKLRVEAIAACEPLVSDCVIAGHDRRELGLLLFPHVPACRALAGLDDDASVETVLSSDSVRAAIAIGLARHNSKNSGSSSRFARALLMSEPPSIDADEITDKGYINQRAVLRNRSAAVTALFESESGVIRPSDSVAI